MKQDCELHVRCCLMASFTVFFWIQTKAPFPMALNLGIVKDRDTLKLFAEFNYFFFFLLKPHQHAKD